MSDEPQNPEQPQAPEEAPGAEATEASDAGAESPAEAAAEIDTAGMSWYVLRVASNKEEAVRETLTRKVAIEGLTDRVGRVLVPTLKERRTRGGSSRIVQRKLYPGYVFVEMRTEEDGSIPENLWFLIKETMGVGDFIGANGKPSPMKSHDVDKMLAAAETPDEQAGLAGLAFKKGDHVKIREGPFENFEGDVEEVMPDTGKVRLVVTIFGRATPLELEYWQVEPA